MQTKAPHEENPVNDYQWWGKNESSGEIKTGKNLSEVLFHFSPYPPYGGKWHQLWLAVAELFDCEPSVVVKLPFVTICRFSPVVLEEKENVS